MNRHLQDLLSRGLPEDAFAEISDTHVWVRRARDWQQFAPALPTDVVGWPKSERIEHLADHLDLIGRSSGSSFRVWRGHYFQTDIADLDDYVEVSLEALMGHLLARSALIGRLARFLRGARRIEIRADAKARSIREEVKTIEASATAHRKRLGFRSSNPVHRVTAALRRSRLSVIQARDFASTAPGRLYMARASAGGTVTTIGLTFHGEHRYGKWKVDSGALDPTVLVTEAANTAEASPSPDLLAELRDRLTPASLFFAPSSIDLILDEVRRYQAEALKTADIRAQVTEGEQAEHGRTLERLDILNELQQVRDKVRRRRIERIARATGHYRRWVAQSTQRLMASGALVGPSS